MSVGNRPAVELAPHVCRAAVFPPFSSTLHSAFIRVLHPGRMFSLLSLLSRRTAPLLCLVTTLVALPLRGATPGMTERMEELVQKQVATQHFSGAVLVATRGSVLFDRAYGLANREWDIPNTPATRFRIGSVTKQFTAVAILLLEERGKLRLEDPVSAHWPEAPEAWRAITLHHLLTHTSGIPNVTRDPEFMLWKFQPTTVREMVGRFRSRPLEFAPGSRHAYSNSNYLVLGLLVERLSGQSYQEFVREAVLAPLGLNDTGVETSLEILPRRASGYWRREGRMLNAPFSDMSVPHAGGAMYSTTHDLRRWCEAILHDQLLAPESRRKLLTPALDSYALGLRVAQFKGRTVIEHGGNISGFSSHLRHYPEEGLTVVVLSNVTSGDGIPELLVRQLAETALGPDSGRLAAAATVVPVAVLENYSGVYDVGGGKTVTFRVADGTLVATPSGQSPVAVKAVSETRFSFENPSLEVEFVRDPATGRVTHLQMLRDGRTRKAMRIGD
jgi:CubicO group peptidase (beta-lactamase class C family)